MKKFLVMLLIFAFSFVLIGCGGSKPEPEDPGTNPENPGIEDPGTNPEDPGTNPEDPEQPEDPNKADQEKLEEQGINITGKDLEGVVDSLCLLK